MIKTVIFLAGLLVVSASRIRPLPTHEKSTKADPGVISDFVVSAATENSVTLTWTLSDSPLDLLKCTVTKDDFFNSDVLCVAPNCEFTEVGLTSCNTFKFAVSCYYADGSAIVQSNKEETTGTTVGLTPGHINNIQVTGTVVTWDNDQCSAEYVVCHFISEVEVTSKCEVVQAETFDLGPTENCATYVIRVHGKTTNGVPGEASIYEHETEKGIPGPVRNLAVDSIGETSIIVSFDEPLSNPLCANGYSFSYGKNTRHIEPAPFPRRDIRHNMTVDSLEACTNYTIDVFAITEDNEKSDVETVYSATAESAPKPPLNVEVGARPDGTIMITWVTDPDDMCASDMEFCFISEGPNPTEDCKYSGKNSSMEYGPLEKCKAYEIVIVPESPSGIPGEPVFVLTDPVDEKPGPVTNHIISAVTSTSLVLTFDDPIDYANCVSGYVHEVTNLNTTERSAPEIYTSKTETFDQLEPCCTYEVTTRAKSLSGKLSTKVNAISTLDEELPDPPTSYEVIDHQSSSTALYLKWHRPLASYYCISMYKLSYASTNGQTGSEEVLVDGSVFEVRHYLQGLTPATEYTVTLIGVTYSGAETTAVHVKATTQVA